MAALSCPLSARNLPAHVKSAPPKKRGVFSSVCTWRVLAVLKLQPVDQICDLTPSLWGRQSYLLTYSLLSHSPSTKAFVFPLSISSSDSSPLAFHSNLLAPSARTRCGWCVDFLFLALGTNPKVPPCQSDALRIPVFRKQDQFGVHLI
jgi:hypothetical protein